MPGRLIDEPRGDNGFGYDPIFVADGNESTNGELAPEAKDEISHRGKALRALVALDRCRQPIGRIHLVSVTAWAAADATSPLAPTFRSSDARRARRTCASTSCTAASAIPTCTRRATSGAAAATRSCPGTRSSGGSATIGADVTRHAVGDLVGVGCMVDSCGECAECREGLQNYCRKGATFTYNSVDRSGTAPRTFGGYSTSIVVTEEFVVSIPDGMDPAVGRADPVRRHHHVLAAAVPRLSARAARVGVAGFGGLGGMAVKLAKAMGAEVTVITRSERKADDARKAGADAVLVSADDAQLRAASRSLDVILSTIPSSHDLMPYLRLLKRDGSYVVLGAIEPLREPINGGLLAGNRISVTGSMIGGMPETQEVLDFCAEHGIAADIQVIPAQRDQRGLRRAGRRRPGLPVRHRRQHDGRLSSVRSSKTVAQIPERQGDEREQRALVHLHGLAPSDLHLVGALAGGNRCVEREDAEPVRVHSAAAEIRRGEHVAVQVADGHRATRRRCP